MRGVKLITNPARAIGVGLAKVLRKSLLSLSVYSKTIGMISIYPATAVFGARYNFSNKAASIEIDPAV